MIAWTCTKCDKTYNLPDSSRPPIRCACGHVEDAPGFTPAPINRKKSPPPNNPPTQPRDNGFITLVHSLWRELHTYNPRTWNAAVAQLWFDAWLARVPSFGCSCNEHFRKLILEKGKEPDFSSREAFFVWSVARHNDVNRKLGKRALSLDDARQLYQVAT